MKQRWKRNNERKLIGGVFSGLGDYAEVNPNILRAGWVAVTALFTTVGIIAYIILYFYMDPRRSQN
jgi:phage shock protein PspC (stress-responsive transcriptional regulator)